MKKPSMYRKKTITIKCKALPSRRHIRGADNPRAPREGKEERWLGFFQRERERDRERGVLMQVFQDNIGLIYPLSIWKNPNRISHVILSKWLKQLQKQSEASIKRRKDLEVNHASGSKSSIQQLHEMVRLLRSSRLQPQICSFFNYYLINFVLLNHNCFICYCF